jgi:hypothetical protein
LYERRLYDRNNNPIGSQWHFAWFFSFNGAVSNSASFPFHYTLGYNMFLDFFTGEHLGGMVLD